MPKLLMYNGRPVKRRLSIGADQIRLTLYSPVKGQPGEHLQITQADWDRLGSDEYRPRDQMPDVRALAAQH